VIDEQQFAASVERERRRRRRDMLLLWALASLLFVKPAHALLGMVGLPVDLRWPLAWLASPLATALVYAAVAGVGGVASGLMMNILHPGRGGEAAPPGFSHAEALAAAGRMEEAAAAFEALHAERGDRAEVLHAEIAWQLKPGGSVERAKTLLQRLRKAAGATRADELYATQRLIDLYLGPLRDPDRAMSELRRVIQQFPGSRDAEGAEVALATLREQARLNAIDTSRDARETDHTPPSSSEP
jgi:tetratricopeptide (TPR) repeat protein